MSTPTVDHRFSVAPMLDWTDRHCRFFLRQLSKHTVLYTEMVTTGAIIYGKGDYLSYNDEEHPVVLQLGGSEPDAMAHCAEIAQARGYDQVNINVGCPSDRVKNGSFGACLMAMPETVAQCVEAMRAKVDIPVTVKCRIGIDDMDDYEGLSRFVSLVAAAGCNDFTVHARKAWLKGLSPKENRDIPPLNYQRVYDLKNEFTDLNIAINGGITTIEEAKAHLEHVDGVMMGREVYSNPFILSSIDNEIYGDTTNPITREQVVVAMNDYIQHQLENGSRVWHIARHVLGLFQSQTGGRIWRRYLSQNGTKRDVSKTLLLDAYEQVLDAQEKAKSFLDSKPSV
ncbi:MULTISPECIES: tRNA dihydrouridine(20/20a) synthase DusA [Alteromonadaceae]|uniref:tRNA-dihydrouridine(20/20a) synthase n=1 Tax=Brumicola blandensis TaxID=3075611 RepID=A0AAW8RAK2_9ALTE|nr:MULTISPECIES: tRNA dihydrouridine(20/20a) synthase DusA [unclassified Alteromonas]MDT0584218.1 tRNA dihydrouridine(20/20a) synthase DusA [Alteromonas sp. W409]MDT0629675.1 tRNA dihydrouridine(20/20a) synthase DusA [Alteromonas sp. W364]